jgi:hypothetical protein
MYIKKHEMQVSELNPEVMLYKTREHASPKKQLDVALYVSALSAHQH